MRSRCRGLGGAILALCIGLSGCASAPSPIRVAGLSTDDVELVDVPFYPQSDDLCGPAALATVLTHAGVTRTLKQLEDEVFIPQRHGSFSLEMLGAARRAGVVPYVLRPDLNALFQEVAAGNPVVVLQNLRFDFLPLWHFSVVVGFDSKAQTVTLRSGDEARHIMSMTDFHRSWSKAGQWAFVALPANRLPATANESDYVNAAITLERVSPDQAEHAFQTALAAWPNNLWARLALGNSRYRQHDLATAHDHYKQATLAHPDSADAWNNLAQVLYDLHQWPQAQQAIAQALAIGGPRLSHYTATQMTIR